MLSIQFSRLRLSDIGKDSATHEDLDSLLGDLRRTAAACTPMVRRTPGQALRVFRFTDSLGLLLGFMAAWAVAAAVNIFLLGRMAPHPWAGEGVMALPPFLLLAVGVVLWFEHIGHYRVRRPFWPETAKILGTLSVAMIIDGFLQFASKQDTSRLWLIGSWAFAALAIIALRAAGRHAMRRRGVWQIPTLIVGRGQTACRARQALQADGGLGYELTARIDDVPQALRRAENSWRKLCADHGAAYVLVALEGEELARCDVALAQLMREHVPFAVVPPLGSLSVLGLESHYFFSHDVMLLTRHCGLEQPLPRFVKRIFDIGLAGMGLMVCSLPFLLLAALIKRDGGPVFYPDQRLGRDGKLFACLKFRSMVVNADKVLRHYLVTASPEIQAEWQSHKKLRGEDPRVTRVGRFLRRWSLDEVPQLWNVLKGEMSLVGPRPVLLREVADYDTDIAHYTRVRPGLTGLWQVSGRNDVTYAERVRMDSWYVRNWSLWNDVVILCKTVPVVLKRKGAY